MPFDPTSSEVQIPSDPVEFSEYCPPNWYTEKGVWMKRRQIMAKGFPCVKDWRFVTGTVDREKYDHPWQAWQDLNESMRYFFTQLRKKYGQIRWCWKLEFHQDGWPHYHMLIEVKKKVDLEFWRSAWGHGRIEVKRSDGNPDYLFKYITKSGKLPDYILDHPKRIRFWQTSRGFYENTPQKPEEKKCKTSTNRKPNSSNTINIRQRLTSWKQHALITYGKCKRRVKLNRTFQDFFLYSVSQRYVDFTKEISFLPNLSLICARMDLPSLASCMAAGQAKSSAKFLQTLLAGAYRQIKEFTQEKPMSWAELYAYGYAVDAN
jgi:hypothetical protein